MIEVQLLGGVEATVNGQFVALGPVKRRAVLAALALSAGAAVPVSRLIDLVWGDAPPRTADKTLQAHVTRLREALGRDRIVRVGAAYRLEVPADAVDVLRFDRLVATGDVDGALRLWTGQPLAGLDHDGFGGAVERLVEQWLGATEVQLARRVEADPAAAVGPLTELTAAHPFREELWALLMTALYRVGRQADALAAYRTASRQLRDQLGIEPGGRLAALQTSILAHDDALDPTPATSKAPDVARGNLAARAPVLLGRDDECVAVRDALATAPLVTLVGPGGIGKTQLALAVAHTLTDTGPEAVWLIELAPVATPADVARVVADTLGVVDRATGDLNAAIVAALRERSALLVVDNCEHVLEAAAETVAAIVAGCPSVAVLATSRERLDVEGEQVVPVAPLAMAAASELFQRRAAAVGSPVGGAADAAAVERICRRLDGVPLAIELAAARTSALAPADLLARLDDALRLLHGGRRDDVAHHRTLRSTIQWSYDLLSRTEQTVLRRLSVFAGPFDLAAAETVVTGGGLDTVDVAVAVGRLVERSMVLATSREDGRELRLLDTVRRFAAEQLAQADEADVLADRHAEWCADAVASVGRLLAGPDELAGVARLAALWPNLRAAFDHACTTGKERLADALVREVVGEIILRSHVEIGDWVERLLGLTPPDAKELLAVRLGWAAQRYAVTHDPHGFDRLAARHGPPEHVLVHHARAFAHEDYAALAELGPPAVAELQRHGQHHLAELTEPDRGVALLNLGRLDEADAHLAPLVDRYRAQGPPTLLNWALMLRGFVAVFRGDVEGSERLFEAAVAVAVPPRTHSPNRPVEARIAWRRGHTAQAVALLRDHVDEVTATDNLQAASLVALELLTMLTARGRREDAARMLGYLEATRLLDAPGFAALAAEPAATVTGDPALGDALAAGRRLDDRAALAAMRGLLAEWPP